MHPAVEPSLISTGRDLPCVFIIHGDCVRETNRAKDFASQLQGARVKPCLMSGSELVEFRKKVQNVRVPFLRETPSILPGPVVALLSEDLLANDEGRLALVESVSGASFVDFRNYFVCVQMPPEDVRSRFPDIAVVLENVNLIEESDLHAVAADLTQSTIGPLPDSRWAADGLILILGVPVGIFLTQIGRIYGLRFLFGAILLVLLYAKAQSAFVSLLIFVCFYTAGLALSQSSPLDVWPWLGRRWKASPLQGNLRPVGLEPSLSGPLSLGGFVAGMIAAIVGRNAAFFVGGMIGGAILQVIFDIAVLLRHRSWLHRFKGSKSAPVVDSNACDGVQQRFAIGSLLELRTGNVRLVLIPGLFIALVAAASAKHFAGSLWWTWLLAFVSGLLTPTARSVCLKAMRDRAERVFGLTSSKVSKIGARLQLSWKDSIVPFKRDAEDETNCAPQELNAVWNLLFRQRDGGGSARPWFAMRDFAFISYVWADSHKFNKAIPIYDALNKLNIPAFLDSREITTRFGSFREPVISAAMRCTHFFLIVTPGIKNGGTVLRELRSIIDRWYTEGVPALICVTEPEYFELLRADPMVPLHVRFALSFFPQMTFAEAADPQRLGEVLALTRRQGKLKDWAMTIASPATAHRVWQEIVSR